VRGPDQLGSEYSLILGAGARGSRATALARPAAAVVSAMIEVYILG